RRPGATAARPLPVSYSDALHGLAFLVALVGIISVTIPPLFVALAVGGLILTARRRAQMARTGASPRWAPVPAMVLVLLGFVIGDGSPTPVVELPAAPAGDVSPVPFAYAPEALDRLPVLQDTAALLFALEPLSRADDPAEGEPEYQLRFVLDSWGRVDAETVRVLPDPGTYALGILRGRMDRVRFRPGELGGRFVRTEVQVPLRGVGGRVGPVLALGSWNPGMDGASTQAGAPAEAAPADVADAEVKPQLLNAGEVQALLAEMYPPLLRDAGITGQTEIRFVVDAEGAVDPTSIVVVSATHEALADASAAVVVGMRFSPARVLGRTVPVLVQIPIAWTLERS
ncbi:MAG TPA: TonB family protein, partial [Longimicrobiaceae bacterium]|nr:TonB family protein [Longimicrobiaceae bacterium]